MKKMFTLLIFVLLLTSTVGYSKRSTKIISENSISVLSDERGDILYVGGTGPDNYTKIQDAINDASHYDIVFVYDNSSPYYENVVIEKQINFIGENKDTTIIDGGRNGSSVSICGYAEKVKLTGFTIQNSGNDWLISGVSISDSTSNIITDNIIINNNDGINLFNSKKNVISNNTITYNNGGGNGMRIWYSSDDNIIFNNTVENNSFNGIHLVDSSHNTIFDNTIKHNFCYGILSSDSDGNIIASNTIDNNGENGIHLVHSSTDTLMSNNTIRHNNRNGIKLLWGANNSTISNNIIQFNNVRGIEIDQSSYNIVSHNTISYNYYEGIDIKESSDNKISMNIINENKYGIQLEIKSNDNVVTGNEICSNTKYGVWIWGSINNSIKKNNIIKNGQTNAIFHAKTIHECNNVWDGNYWGRPRLFPKLILGGIGPERRIPWLNIDWHPAKTSYEI